MIRLDYRTLPGIRPVQPVYQAGTRCPGCSHGGWHVGHRTAECGRCGTVLPLPPYATESAAA